MNEEGVRITYRGWPGHYCSARYCIFRLNTLIEVGDVRVVVSTVGNAWDPLDKNGKPMEVSIGRYYETMAFQAVRVEDRYWDADVCKTINISGEWMVSEFNIDSDVKAQDMHEAAVKDIVLRIQKGELK